jgi:hypothetical protein
MARLEKRRMTESANNPTTTTTAPQTNRQASSTLMVNGIPPTHSNNEIENLLFKHEQDPNPQFAVTLPENILLNHPITHFTSPPTSTKRPRPPDEHSGQMINGPLSSTKKSRPELLDETKLHSSSGKSTKKNRNKNQPPPQPLPPQTIIKTAASGIFPQQAIAVQHIEESSDDVSLSLSHLTIQRIYCIYF